MMLHRAIDVDLVEAAHQLVLQFVTEEAEPLGFFGHLAFADLTSRTQSDDARNVKRAGAHAALVAATIHLGRDLHTRIPAPNVNGSHSLRTIQLLLGQ